MAKHTHRSTVRLERNDGAKVNVRRAEVRVEVVGAGVPVFYTMTATGPTDPDALTELWRRLRSMTAAVEDAGKLARRMDGAR